MIEATLPRPERDGHARAPDARRGRRARPRAPSAGALVLTHISDELDEPWARAEAERGVRRRRSRSRREGAVYELLRAATLAAMPPERDLFANFERMRREMDELFGDVFGAAGRRRGAAASRPRSTSSTPDDPPRAVVHAELAGIDPDEIGLEIQGRELVIAGHRRPAEAEGRVYQQLEIELGPFRRSDPARRRRRAPTQARATYRDGILRVELPLAAPEARSRSVPIERAQPTADVE